MQTVHLKRRLPMSLALLSPLFMSTASANAIVDGGVATDTHDQSTSKFINNNERTLEAKATFLVSTSETEGTGVLVAPNVIMTNAHVVFDGARNLVDGTSTIHHGLNGQTQGTTISLAGAQVVPLRADTISTIFPEGSGGRIDADYSTHDVAFIVLPQAVTNFAPDAHIAQLSNEVASGTDLTIYGYPTSTIFGEGYHRIHKSTGKVTSVDTQSMHTGADIYGGNSGSGAWVNGKLVGLMNGTTSELSASTEGTSVGAAFSGDYYNEIVNKINELSGGYITQTTDRGRVDIPEVKEPEIIIDLPEAVEQPDDISPKLGKAGTILRHEVLGNLDPNDKSRR